MSPQVGPTIIPAGGTIGNGGIAPSWKPVGPNPVIIAGGGQAVEAVLVGNPTYSRSGGSSASASSGQGGWQITDRTRNKAATEWLDYYPFAMTMKLRLDDQVQGDGQTEVGIFILEGFETPAPGSVPPQPPILVVWGPVPHTDLFWVCSRLAFDGADGDVIMNQQGDRIVQNLTVELTEYSPSAAIARSVTPAVASALTNNGPTAQQGILVPSGKTYTVQTGDTLYTIAARILGNAALWVQLAILNGLSNSALLRPGQVLQLPAY
jgi:LysM repeat protein